MRPPAIWKIQRSFGVPTSVTFVEIEHAGSPLVEAGADGQPADLARTELGGVGQRASGCVGVRGLHVADRGGQVRRRGERVVGGEDPPGHLEGRRVHVRGGHRLGEAGHPGLVDRTHADVPGDHGVGDGRDPRLRQDREVSGEPQHDGGGALAADAGDAAAAAAGAAATARDETRPRHANHCHAYQIHEESPRGRRGGIHEGFGRSSPAATLFDAERDVPKDEFASPPSGGRAAVTGEESPSHEATRRAGARRVASGTRFLDPGRHGLRIGRAIFVRGLRTLRPVPVSARSAGAPSSSRAGAARRA